MDIQARMRLKLSADKLEVRQSYIPALFPYVVKPLMDEGAVRLRLELSSLPSSYTPRRVPWIPSLIGWTITSSIARIGTRSLNLG